ncbi:MAG: hypothetical protein GY810_13590 [Aureispira sp.]|nr:hypothetical protein [Aureispira sp.]
MDLIKFKTKLDKINRYYEYIAQNGQVSNIERDAMMVYIRDLYDVFFQEAVVEAPKEVVKETPKVSEAPVETVTKTVTVKKRPKLVFTNTEDAVAPKTTPVTKKEEPKPIKKEEAPKKVETPKVKPVVKEIKPIVKEEPKPIKKEEAPKKVETPKVKPVVKEVKPIVKKEPTPPKKEEAPKEVAATGGFNEEYEELFLFKEATDLSQKLSASPIKDLSKALGLNEKFLFINELFGGSANDFKGAIDAFNQPMANFDEVRLYMEKELVEKFGWLGKLKKAVAKDFVKLVRRRYL